MSRTKVSYSLTRRPSQAKVASIYQEIIRERYELTGDPDAADIVIIHHPPWHYQTSYSIHPRLNEKYAIACCVSHGDDIPATWKHGLKLVQEVWTCSQYCYDVFSKYHPNVVKLPYVVERDMAITDEAGSCAKRLIAYDPECMYFFTIAQASEPRKNIEALVKSFTKVSDAIPQARLIIKGAPDDRTAWSSHERVTFLPMTLRHEYINALYELVDVYVSAHHAESWGTTISDAMLFRKPVIATGYSGNLEYMNNANSFLLSFHEDKVASGARGVAIEAGMNWVTPDPASLEENLVKLATGYNSLETQEKTAQAYADVMTFNKERAASIIYDRIDRATGSTKRQEPALQGAIL